MMGKAKDASIFLAQCGNALKQHTILHRLALMGQTDHLANLAILTILHNRRKVRIVKGEDHTAVITRMRRNHIFRNALQVRRS